MSAAFKTSFVMAFGMHAVPSGCGAQPMPLAESGPVEVVAQGQSFVADLQPGPALAMCRERKDLAWIVGGICL